MPKMPEDTREGILKGLYRYQPAKKKLKHRVQLFGSGCILRQVLKAQEILAERYQVAADVWSVTSYQELRRDALECERYTRLHPKDDPKVPYLTQALKGVKGPFVAATDYMKAVPEQIARFVPGRLVPLGTDGFGLSDTRETLRRHFEVDAESVVLGALDALRLEGKVEPSLLAQAIQDLDVDPDKLAPADV